jgi:hypothetical protein
VLRVTREDEVGRRRQDLETQPQQGTAQRLATAMTACRVFEILLVADRGDGAGNRQAIERIRVEAVLDAFERLDQVGWPTA